MESSAATLLVAAGTLALMLATEPKMAMVWDEGQTLGREARVRLWFQLMASPLTDNQAWPPSWTARELVLDPEPPPSRAEVSSRSALFHRATLRWFWPFAREEPHGHPPFYALVGLVGDLVAPRWVTLPRARLGPMLVFSLTAAALFAACRSRWGVWAGLLAAGAWALQPQLFANGHYAGYDALLSSLWVGAILAFASAIEAPATRPRWGWAVAFGVLCGFAAATKLTGWFLPLPFIAWCVIARSGRGVWTLVVGGFAAILALYACNPAWWVGPVSGPIAFFRSNLSRAQTIPIPVMFLGQTYMTPRQSLPWYNTLVWTAVAVPVGFLSLAIAGAVRSIRSRDALLVLAVGNWLFLLILRALPHTPGHDGVRQFLPAFGCLAIVAGAGAGWVVGRFGAWGKALVAAALVEGAASVALFMPVPLSYFSPVIGGLPGASRIGMEPTYFWDAMSAEALETLYRRTPASRSVRFATNTTSWIHLRQTGAMRFPFVPVDPGYPAWYVVQNRPGQFSAVDRALVRKAEPRHVLVEKFGVPLIWAFPYDEFLLEERRRSYPRESP